MHDDYQGASDSPLQVIHERGAHLSSHAATSHTEHALTYLVEGAFEMEHGQRLRVEPGMFSVVPAGVPHQVLGGQGVEYWMVEFCCSCLGLDEAQRLMQSFQRVRHGALPTVTVKKTRQRRVVRLFRELADELNRDAPESIELGRSLLLLLLGEVLRAMPGSAVQAPQNSLVADSLEFIQKRCLSPISLRDVAAAVHRSPTHVATTLKQSTGHSVGEWITAGRVAEAAVRLAHTDDSLDEIAQAVGWNDKTHFIRQFRKSYGETPAAWRRGRRHRSDV